jgi:AbrB family looped-hinge helix DNA binding protein
MVSKTRISQGNSTVLPSKIRRMLGLQPGDVLEWEVEDGVIRIRPRKKAHLRDLVGLISSGGDAVASKKAVQRGIR